MKKFGILSCTETLTNSFKSFSIVIVPLLNVTGAVVKTFNASPFIIFDVKVDVVVLVVVDVVEVMEANVKVDEVVIADDKVGLVEVVVEVVVVVVDVIADFVALVVVVFVVVEGKFVGFLKYPR